jgi:hypothetical protein
MQPTTLRRLLPAACFLTLIGCGPPPGSSGGGLPPGASPMGMPASRDPVGFLLQNRDSIGINDVVTQQLVQLNLRLFRRNREAQLHLDSILHNVRIDQRAALRGDTTRQMPDSLRERAAPWQAQIETQTAAVRDTAWAMLTDDQKSKATAIESRMIEMMRRRGRPTMGPTTGAGRP